MNWSDLRKTMGFVESTMNVSARRDSITPASLTHPLAFYQTRYQFLLRCGYYRHPDPGAKAKIPAEASHHCTSLQTPVTKDLCTNAVLGYPWKNGTHSRASWRWNNALRRFLWRSTMMITTKRRDTTIMSNPKQNPPSVKR